MAVYISHDLYLSSQPASEGIKGRGLIGWHSRIPLNGISVQMNESDIVLQPVLWSPDTYSRWAIEGISSTETTARIILDNPSAGAVSYIGIAGHNFGINSTGNPYTYHAEISFDGVTWEPVTAPTSQLDNRSIMLVFPSVSAPLLSVFVTNLSGPFDYQVAHVRAGELLRLQRPMYVGIVPWTLDKYTDRLRMRSDTGKYLGDKLLSQGQRYEIRQQHSDPDWVRERIDPFLDHADLIGGGGVGPKGSFFGAWRPDMYPDEILYCHAPASSSIQRPRNQLANGMMEWSVSGDAEP